MMKDWRWIKIIFYVGMIIILGLDTTFADEEIKKTTDKEDIIFVTILTLLPVVLVIIGSILKSWGF